MLYRQNSSLSVVQQLNLGPYTCRESAETKQPFLFDRLRDQNGGKRQNLQQRKSQKKQGTS
jgi:hypothetical protein